MKKKILIVEDELIIAAVYAMFLKEQGFDVIGKCASADKAIAVIENNPPDLIIMDIQLAGNIDGIELAKQIRNSRNTPIIFTTGNSENETAKKIKDISNTAALSKPVSNQVLMSSIEKMLN